MCSRIVRAPDPAFCGRSGRAKTPTGDELSALEAELRVDLLAIAERLTAGDVAGAATELRRPGYRFAPNDQANERPSLCP